MARNLSDEVRAALMENSDWNALGLTLDESVLIYEEDEDEDELEDEDEDEYEYEYEDEDELEEEASSHVCPLCTSELSEAISEDTLMEHLDVVLTLVDKLSALNEGDELDMDTLVDEALSEIFGSDEDE